MKNVMLSFLLLALPLSSWCEEFKDCADCPLMVVIPAGSFEMGTENVAADFFLPVHRVTVRRFALGKTEVTQEQWRSIMGDNPNGTNDCGDTCPAVRVSWEDAQRFVAKLSQKTGNGYRLPSEAEWEYACHAGETHTYCGSNDSDLVAWNRSNSLGNPRSVATKRSNNWGLHDMSGSVWEWTQDCYNKDYENVPTDGSPWESGNCEERVLRGGSWDDNPEFARADARSTDEMTLRYYIFGIRVVRVLP